MRVKVFVAIILSSFFWSCSSGLSEYHTKKPALDLFSFFEGEVYAWGMVQDWRGKQIRRFDVSITGHITDDGVLVLDEDFVYEDGEKQNRVWRIKKRGESGYEGQAEDVVGVAEGYVSGNALHWKYVLRVPFKDGSVDLTMDDWMFLQDKNHMFNVTKMKKFGIEVGKVTLFFSKNEKDESGLEDKNEFSENDMRLFQLHKTNAGLSLPPDSFRHEQQIYSF